MRTRFPVGRTSAVAALLVGVFLVTHHGGETRWRALRAGAEFTTLRGEPWCRSGSAELGVLRVDAGRVPMRVRHFTAEPAGRPLDILEWQRNTGALAVFNAGQYYPDLRYMGLLASGGTVISRAPHPTFQAAFVAGPRGPRRPARVLDLARERLDPDTLGWAEVAQSYMLFDRTGRVRVRRSDQVANRTAVAEDKEGRIVVVVSEGGYTLYEFARLLQSLPLGLAQAMAMDGGREAELVVNSGGFHYASFGHWPRAGEGVAPVPPVTLPAVVTVGAK
jgi:uncharacterized protein YigE (DUF2233 family)